MFSDKGNFTACYLITAMLALVIAAVALPGCSGGNEPALDRIVTITASWQNEQNQDHFFVFQSDDDGKTEGTFNGEENQPDGKVFDLTGSWAHGKISFTVDYLTSSTTYSADVPQDNPTRLTFTFHPNGTLTLVQPN